MQGNNDWEWESREIDFKIEWKPTQYTHAVRYYIFFFHLLFIVSGEFKMIRTYSKKDFAWIKNGSFTETMNE